MDFKVAIVFLSLAGFSLASDLVDVSVRGEKNDNVDFPRTMITRFVADGKEVALNLRRSTNVNNNIDFRVVEGEGGKPKKVKLPRSENYAAYQDLDKSAVVQVRTINIKNKKSKDSKRKRILEGSFVHNNARYEIRAANDDDLNKRDLDTKKFSNPHIVSKKAVYDEAAEKKDALRRLVLKRRGTQKKEYLAEVAFFIDVTLYDKYMKKFNNDEAKALSTIRYRYIHMANGMDMAYKRIASIDIGVRLTSIYVAKDVKASAMTTDYVVDGKKYDKNSNPKTLKMDGYKTLDDIYKWGVEHKLKFDHIMAWTIFDMIAVDETGPGDVIGLSPLEGACSESKISICEDTGFHAWSTAAHELGHNLGMNHDGESGNTCKPALMYIMTPAAETLSKEKRDNAFKFSPCSEKEVEKFVTNLQDNCLKVAYSNEISADLKKYLETLPGQKYDIATQCKFTHGAKSVPCGWKESTFSYADMCFALMCTDKTGYCLTSDLWAAKGTTCGQKKWCDNGHCVSNEKAGSFKNPSCPFGDDSTYMFTNADDQSDVTCKSPDIKGFCYDADIKRACCAACGEATSSGNTDAGGTTGDNSGTTENTTGDSGTNGDTSGGTGGTNGDTSDGTGGTTSSATDYGSYGTSDSGYDYVTTTPIPEETKEPIYGDYYYNNDDEDYYSGSGYSNIDLGMGGKYNEWNTVEN